MGRYIMAKRVYPVDILNLLPKAWPSDPMVDGFPRIELPDARLLGELLNVCYQASMLMDEGRPITFRVTFLPSTRSIEPKLADDTYPVFRYVLRQPLPFQEAELRRLAPVADPRRVLIAVEPSHDKLSLQIYALIDVGMSLWAMARHERHMGIGSPDALTVSSTRPGEISISRGDTPILRLREGSVLRPAESVLYEGPIAEFFDDAAKSFAVTACKRAGRTLRQEKDNDDLWPSYMTFIERILLDAAELSHGGTILFVPDEMSADDPRLLNRVDIKYVMQSQRPREALLTKMESRLLYSASIFSKRNMRRRGMSKRGERMLDNVQEQATDTLRDVARFVASLTAVDGAVVITDMLRIIGFGAEITADAKRSDSVYVATSADGVTGKANSIRSFGTRHRSAFRFCSSIESAVAFVLSQDGGIKAVKQCGSRLIMWPYFKIGFSTALS
jgi:hypothetical protein